MKKALIIVAAVYVAVGCVVAITWKTTLGASTQRELLATVLLWPVIILRRLFTPAASQPNGTSPADILGRTLPDPPARTTPTRPART